MSQFRPANWLLATACLLVAAPASADLLGNFKKQATESLGGSGTPSNASGLGGLGLGSGLGSGLGLPSLSSGATSNVAGVLQYCVKNNYLNATNADKVKQQLLGKLGMESPAKQQQDTGYQQGLAGLLSGQGGASFDLNQIKGDLKEKACDYVLENAGSLL